MVAQAQRLEEDARTRTEWITGHSATLSGQGTQMARFHGERAQAAMARAKLQLEGVEGLLKTVANLKLYTGDGVEAIQLRDGEPAPAGLPLTFFQELLAFDEETLLHLDKGGLDHRDVDDLAVALADDALVARMIPAPRGAVLCQFRGSNKVFEQGESMATALYNAAMNESSKYKRLLVRDGQRLWLEVLQSMTQLMPSVSELVDADDRWGRNMGPLTREDLEYAASQRRQIGRLDRYGQVLIALWGLRDRTQFLDGSGIPQFTNWLDPAFQNRHLALVSLDNMLGVMRPSFGTWRHEHNAYLDVGAWVAADLDKGITPHSVPAAFSNADNQIYRCALPMGNRVVIERVRSDDTGLFITIPLEAYERSRKTGDHRRIKAKLYLRKHDRRWSDWFEEFLVLDRASSHDLDYYLSSREQRRSYSRYIALFRKAHEWVLERDVAELDLDRHLLADALAEPGNSGRQAILQRNLIDVLAMLRAGRRDGTCPGMQQSGIKPFYSQARSLMASLTHDAHRVAQALDTWAIEHERTLLRLVLTAENQFHAYMVPSQDEHDERLGPAVHASVAQVQLEEGGLRVKFRARRLLRLSIHEIPVRQWDGTGKTSRVTEWERKNPEFQLSYADALSALDLKPDAEQLDLIAAPPEQLTRIGEAYSRRHTKGSVVRMALREPVGAALIGDTPYVLFARVDTLALAYMKGCEREKQAVRDAIRRRYANPEYSLESLPELGWQVEAVHIGCVDRVDKPGAFGKVLHEDACLEPGKKLPRSNSWDGPKAIITGCTPRGHELFPWLGHRLHLSHQLPVAKA